MIDLHTHILPGMDDGSQSPGISADMLSLLRAQGITTVVATPHFYPKNESPQDFLARRAAAAAKLPALPEGMEILLGAEVAYYPGMGTSDSMIPLQIGNTKLLLVEMPFQPWTDRMIRDICDIPMQLGLVPVLAHVNRYPAKNQLTAFLPTLLDAGVLFQCNTEAFDTFLSRRWALKLIREGHIQFLGSDCHNLSQRPPKIAPARQIIAEKLGKAFLLELDENAADLLVEK